jgi:2-methylcitrate dehydratase PrpD
MNYTYELARYCSELRYEELPEEVLAKAKKCIADFCAIVVGARKIDKAGKMAEFVRRLGKDGPSSVIGYGIKTSPPLAALATGTFAEILEYQDGVRKGGNHPSSSMTPAAVAIAEANANSGKDFIAAVVAGYEAENRVAAAMATSHLQRGHLPNGTAGAVGAAVAASRLYGFDARQTADAMGIAGFLAPVSINDNLFGCYTIKIVHGGQAARIGIEAAEWTQLGFTGCPLEGSPDRGNGFCAVMSDNPDYTEFTEGLGKRFTILDVYPKPYACCRITHPSADATLKLVREHDLKPEDVEGVTVTTYEYAAETVGANYPDGSDNFQRCQFGIPYVVAAAIIERSVKLPQFTYEKITDSKFIEMSRLVRVVGDPELNKVYPATRPSIVEIRTSDGRCLSERVDYPLGDARNPFTEEMFWDKFDLLISFGLGMDHIQEIKNQLDLLDSSPDIAGLVSSLH